MIQTNELRVGNYVWSTLEGGKKEHKVESRDIALGTTGKIHSFSPIELTEDWIKNLGFNKFQGIYVKTKKGGQQFIVDQTDRGNFRFVYTMSFFTCLYHVHELQNLFFAVMKQELTA